MKSRLAQVRPASIPNGGLQTGPSTIHAAKQTTAPGYFFFGATGAPEASFKLG
jgi:hypothetical protein